MKYRLKIAELERSGEGLAPRALDRIAATLDEAGVVVLEQLFPPVVVEGLHRAFLAQYGRMNAAEMAAATQEPGSPVLEVGHHRYEIVMPMVDEFRDRNVFAHRHLIPVLRQLLGDDLQLSVFSVVVAHPGSADQHTHRDHDHLFPRAGDLSAGLPTFAVNVAVPLVDVDRKNGPTAFWLGSHHWQGTDDIRTQKPVVPELERGDCLLVDYRTLHGGTPNTSDAPRPILYMAYARPWFFDQVNHKKRASLDMPFDEGEKIPEGLEDLLARAIAENAKQKALPTKRRAPPRIETDPATLRKAMAWNVRTLSAAGGELVLPALPAKVAELAGQLVETAAVIGRPFDTADGDALRAALRTWLTQGFDGSPHAWVRVTYNTDLEDPRVLHWNLQPLSLPEAAAYEDDGQGKGPPLLDAAPDARLLRLAQTLGPPREVAFLDVGAARGRNALSLARLGHPTDAVEPIPEIAKWLEERLSEERLPVTVVPGDFWDEAVALPRPSYRLVRVSEPRSRLRGLTTVRALFRRISQVLEPGGVALLHVFVTRGDYSPDPEARELAEAMSCPMYTREELEDALFGVPLELVSDESVLEYERAHRASWPPAPWYAAWAEGQHVFHLESAVPPVELRWLVYRRR